MPIALAALLLAAAPTTDPVIGTWLNPKQTITVKTRRCGAQLCGRVVAATPHAVEKARAAGVERLVGTELFQGFRRDGAGWSGRLFVPDQGQTVDSQLRLNDRDTLEISGCLVSGLLCKTQEWTRVARR